VPIIEYQPEHFEVLQNAVRRIPGVFNLRYRPFVDYYYTANPWCKLYLAMENGDVLATLGFERMGFEYGSKHLTVGFGTNFYSFRAGVGAVLFRQWLRSCDAGLEYGGSDDAHRLIRSQKWVYYSGVRQHFLNHPRTVYLADAFWRRAAKRVLRWWQWKPIPRYAARLPGQLAVSVREERDYAPDLLPARSPFGFRFAPAVDYLAWRYNTRLPFARYRLFRIVAGSVTIGYVIIQDSPAELIVAQCDGEDAEMLAYGVMLSILEAAKHDRTARTATLVCCHPGMRSIYRRTGFIPERADVPFALGPPQALVEVSHDTSSWNINFGWGDNGLLGPFPGQSSA
jgi:hypothetical protein